MEGVSLCIKPPRGEGMQMGPGLKMRSESRKAELRSRGDSSEEDTFKISKSKHHSGSAVGRLAAS